MQPSTYLAILPLVTTAFAAGTARIVNNCNTSVFLWAMGDAADGPYQLGKSGTYSEPFGIKSDGSGRAIALSLQKDGPFTSKPTLTYAYALTNHQVWYNLSEDFGQPFNQTLQQTPSDPGCAGNTWVNGKAPGGSQVQVCQENTDVTLTLCCA